jgi:protein transport protein SEC24
MLLPKIENPTDVSSKFGATNNYFSNTAAELAHAQISVD